MSGGRKALPYLWLAVFLGGCSPERVEPPPPSGSTEIAVTTLNVLRLRAAPGPERIARAVADQPTDLLALQEASTGYFGRRHTHRHVRRALGDGATSEAWVATSGLAGVFLDGLSLFTRRPELAIVHVHKRRLSWYLTRLHFFLERRYVQYGVVEVATDGGPGRLGVLNVHLTHRGETERWPEAQRLLAFADGIRDHPDFGAEAQIMLGDFNAVPGSRVHEALVAAGFVDAWAVARPGEDGFTWDELPGNTEAGGRTPPLACRIDYVFVRGPAIEVLAAERVFDERVETPDGDRANISDHYGVQARLLVDWDPWGRQPAAARERP